MRPDFKILQFDGDAINIRTNQHYKIMAADSNDKSKVITILMKDKDILLLMERKHTLFIGKDDLVNLIIRELKLEDVELYSFDKEKDIKRY